VICLGGKVIGSALALELIRTFLTASFSNASRHRRRLTKVQALESDKIGQLSLPIKHHPGKIE
jgi:ribose 5-phosphate isomerase B